MSYADHLRCGCYMTVCPACGHAWWKHDARSFRGCVGNKEGGGPEDQCRCQMTKEQAEREHRCPK